MYFSTVGNETTATIFFFSLFESLPSSPPTQVKVHSSITQSPLSSQCSLLWGQSSQVKSVRPKNHGRVLAVFLQPQGAGFIFQASATCCTQLLCVGCKETAGHLRGWGAEQAVWQPGQRLDLGYTRVFIKGSPHEHSEF